MKKLEKLEFRRQIFHLVLGISIVMLILFNLLTRERLVWILVIGAILSFISIRKNIPGISWLLKIFDRPKVRFPGEGAFYYILGCTISLYLFQLNIALASIMVLALGDSFSHILGKTYGVKKFGMKTLMGTFAGIFFGYFGALVFVDASMAFLGTTVAMLVEAIELRVKNIVLDDNILIPLISGLVMQIVQVWF